MAATCTRKHETLTNFIISRREKLCLYELFETTCSTSYKLFFQNYLLPNKPCIFSSSSTKDWPCRRDWVCEGAPNFAVLRTLFGTATAPVANCKEEEFSSHPKQDMTLKDYLDYWEDYRDRGYPETDPCLYLKDWHFTMAFPEYEAYTTPTYFLSDWLNEYWEALANQDDYRFVYMGPKGSWTPFHADVYRSYSWSANICGRKLWIFYLPGEEEHLRDRFNNLVYDVTSPDLQDSFMFPNYSTHNDNRLEIIQEQGQIIFVPSGWHHQVYNLEDTISINHNWLNGCNIDLCWKHLKDSLCNVKKEISDCKDMDGWHTQCQMILKASSGIDYRMFYDLLNTIGKKRLDILHKMKREHMSDTKKESYRLRKGDPSEGPGNRNAALDQFDDVDKLVGNSGLEFDNVNKHSENDIPCIGRRKEELCKLTSLNSETNKGDQTRNRFSEPGTTYSKYLSPEMPGDRDHIMFDLYRIKEVLKDIMNDTDFKLLNIEKCSSSLFDLQFEID